MSRTHYIAISVFAMGLTSLIVIHPWDAALVMALLGGLTFHVLNQHFDILAIRHRLPLELPPTRPFT